MKFTTEHEQIRQTVARFVDEEMNPYVDEWEAAGEFPSHELFGKLGALGLLGINYDTAYGGLGLDFSYSAVVAEQLGACHCSGVPMAIGVHTDMATPALHRFGSEALKEEFLVPSIAGEVVSSIGVSETGAGSDVANVKTQARKDGDDYVISGSKMWITNGMKADWCCVLANTSDSEDGKNVHRNKSLIIVPLNLPGVSRVKIEKLGMHSSDTAQLFFDDVRVPQRYRIGDEGRGFKMQMLQFQEERLWAALRTIRNLDRIISLTVDYTRERRVFGGSVLSKQVVYHRLAELRTEVEALRSLVWRAVEAHIEGEDVTLLASMAKLKGGRLNREVPDACLQYWGGMGFSAESPISRAYRDGRLGSIGGGADEVMLEVIAKREGFLD